MRNPPKTRSGSGDAAQRLHARLIDSDASDDLAPEVRAALPANVVRLLAALTLQKVGDRIVDPKTVLAWLLASVGAPASLTGLLVPVRESGALLPQAALVPVITGSSLRKSFWVLGAIGQAVAVAVMAATAMLMKGASAAFAILAALVMFAGARALCSIAAKDVLGRTVPKGERGQVLGLAVLASGAVAITVGMLVRVLGGEDVATGVFGALLAVAALCWVVAALAFAQVEEAHAEDIGEGATMAQALELLRSDDGFRMFVLARGLLLVSALSPPFVVQLAVLHAGAGVRQLGPFLVASGVAALVGGRVWGRLADDSSRGTMAAAAGAASLVIVLLLVAMAVPGLRGMALLYPIAHLLLSLAHVGARVGRKTYLVDMASGNRRTAYVAVSNSAMGLVLLVVGTVSAAAAVFSVEIALALLAAIGMAGVVVSRRLPEVSR